MPEVSVVIPSLRGGIYLREAIESVLIQSLADWELIVVLDGFDDAMPEFSDERIRVLRQGHRGTAIARNVGVRLARASLIAFLDDDDRMLPERLEAQVTAMKDAEAGLCHTQFRFIDDAGAVTGPGDSSDVQYKEMLRRDGYPRLSTVVARRELLQDIGGFNSIMPISQDLDLFYRLALESTFLFVPETLVEYRRHTGNTTHLENRFADRVLTRMISQHLSWAERVGDEDAALAAKVGLGRERRHRSAVELLRLRKAYHDHRVLGGIPPLLRAVTLSPTLAIRDLLGNRWPFSIRRRRRESGGTS